MLLRVRLLSSLISYKNIRKEELVFLLRKYDRTQTAEILGVEEGELRGIEQKLKTVSVAKTR